MLIQALWYLMRNIENYLMNRLIVVVVLCCNIYSQKSICGNSILNQTNSDIERELVCEINQFKIKVMNIL